VNNVNGGFWNFLLTWQEGREDDVIYLQLEEHFLHVKLKIRNLENEGNAEWVSLRGSIARKYRHILLTHLSKPDGFENTRIKVGEYMTLARLNIVENLGGQNMVVNVNEVKELLVEAIHWVELVNSERESLGTHNKWRKI
jgi:hypothetical protein